MLFWMFILYPPRTVCTVRIYTVDDKEKYSRWESHASNGQTEAQWIKLSKFYNRKTVVVSCQILVPRGRNFRCCFPICMNWDNNKIGRDSALLHRAGHATILPRQRDHVFRPQSCLLLLYYYICCCFSI